MSCQICLKTFFLFGFSYFKELTPNHKI
jgi:hypothetical protein